MSSLLFSTIDVTRQAFYRSALSYAIVNLKPIVPGHVLVIPTRPVERLADLTQDEVSSLFGTAQKVGNAIESAYKADALTMACQDGKAAGQSIPHVHIHILPRRFKGDRFEGADDNIYPAIERAEIELAKDIQPEALKVDADEDRKPRSLEEMENEANWLRSFFN
ncbi:HIT-like protein [Hysterangium stoloniferum]|nr:HIT-like protein [Hysterangium stoloniferum]